MLENLTPPPPSQPTSVVLFVSNYKALLFQQTTNCSLKYINQLRLTRVTFIGHRTNKGVPLQPRSQGFSLEGGTGGKRGSFPVPPTFKGKTKELGSRGAKYSDKTQSAIPLGNLLFREEGGNVFCLKYFVRKALFSEERLNCKCCGTFICSKICLRRKKVPSLR